MSSIFQQLLEQGTEISFNSIASSSKTTYNGVISVYFKVMNEKIKEIPFPITIDKLIAFMVFQKNNGRKCSTLMNYVAGFSYYFKDNNLDNLTQDIRFKSFKSGLRRTMHSGIFPNQKEPFNPDWFKMILHNYPVSLLDNLRFMFLITISWSCFLRISELINLRKSDFHYDEKEEILCVSIVYSKTDQFGKGEKCYVKKTEAISNPIQYLNYLDYLEDDQRITPTGMHALRSHLTSVLKNIGVENFENYSFHSFRRGAAYLASIKGIQDCVIKKHGRWKSEAYIGYVAIDSKRAGSEISIAINI